MFCRCICGGKALYCGFQPTVANDHQKFIERCGVMESMIHRVLSALIFVLVMSTFVNGQSERVSLPKVERVTVVVCDGLTLKSLMQIGEPIATLLRNSALGLLSGSSLELSGHEGVFVTLGSGRRAKASERAALGEWLAQSGKSLRLNGDGVLEAITGVKVSYDTKPACQPDVTFVAATKASLSKTVKRFMAQVDENSCLWLVVPNSPQTDWSNRRLTPILVFGKKVPSGLLTSPTTRKIGLVSSVDFAPTLLTQLGLSKPATMTGSEMKIVRFECDRLSYLKWLDERSIKPLSDLPALTFAISAITATALLLVVLASVSVTRPLKFLSTKHLQIFKSATVFSVLVGMSIPVSLFFVTYLPHGTGVGIFLQLLLLTCVFASISFGLANWLGEVLSNSLPVPLRTAGWISAFTATVALLGVPLYWATPLGHYPTTGWRYFGITNSGVGLALAGTVFAWKLLSLPDRFIAIWMALSPLLAGFPLWGANFGGALTLAIGFAASWAYLTGGRISWHKVVGSSLLAAALTVAILSVAENFFPIDRKAHLGQLLERMELLGFTALVEMVKRKLVLLWEFFARTPLNFALLSLFILFHLVVALSSHYNRSFVELKPVFIATLFGSWVGLLLNDSGIEVVGMAMVIFSGVFLLAFLEDIVSSQKFLILSNSHRQLQTEVNGAIHLTDCNSALEGSRY